MENGIHVEVIWFDRDVVECGISCSNGAFSGCAEIYIGHDDLQKMAEALAGFPSTTTDCRDLELGTFNPEFTDGGIRMHICCVNSQGHAAVEVKLRGDACKAMGEAESVALRIPVQAAAIDSFVTQLRTMGIEVGATAHLQMVK